MAGMPHLVQMDKRNREKGLRLIGAECQNSTQETIDKVVKEHKIEFPIIKGAQAAGDPFRGIPHMFVFNTEGTLVFQGHPNNAEKVIKDELRNVGKEAAGLGAGGGSALDNLRPKTLVEEREWTNTDGNKLKASLLSVEGGKGKFRYSNGRTFDYELEKLSEEDQKLVKEAVSE